MLAEHVVRAVDADGDLQSDALADGEVYHSPTVFQLKAMLYHVGILRLAARNPTVSTPRTTNGVSVTP